MHARISLLIGAALLLATPVAWSIPGASLDDDGSAPKTAASAQDATVYDASLALMKKGDALGGQPGAQDAYGSARVKLQSLVGRSPQ